jgi:hypothetical protein
MILWSIEIEQEEYEILISFVGCPADELLPSKKNALAQCSLLSQSSCSDIKPAPAASHQIFRTSR